MRGGPRTPRIYSGNCIKFSCNLPIHANNLCNKHYLEDYFSREARSELDRGRRGVRRNTLAYEMYELTGIPYKKCLEIVNIIFKQMTEAINRGEEVKIPGFGIFGTHKFSKYHFGYPVYFWPSKELRKMLTL